MENGHLSSEICPVDSSVVISMMYKEDQYSGKDKGPIGAGNGDLHPMQSIFLGSDRRYNRYWIFLGPCDTDDPGHKRVYFESSEDGQWQVIDSEEVTFANLFLFCLSLELSCISSFSFILSNI